MELTRLLPTELKPTGTIPIRISGDQTITLNKCTPAFRKWRGAPVPTFGGKEILDINGSPAYAELAILRLLEKEGWNGVWVSAFGSPRFRKNIDDRTDIVSFNDSPAARIIHRLARERNGFGGTFDVAASNGQEMLFAEAKRAKRDQIKSTQVDWLRSALATGVPIASFLVVEWSLQPD
jgi:hypothetical protein